VRCINNLIKNYKVSSVITYEADKVGLQNETDSQIVYFVTIDYIHPLTIVVDKLDKVNDVCDKEIEIVRRISRSLKDIPIKISIVNLDKDKRRIVIIFERNTIKTNFVIRYPHYIKINVAGLIILENPNIGEVRDLMAVIHNLKRLFRLDDEFKTINLILKNLKVSDEKDMMTI